VLKREFRELILKAYKASGFGGDDGSPAQDGFSILSEDIPKGGPLQRGRINRRTGLAPKHQSAPA